MPAVDVPVLAVDGPPGAGKTSVLAHLIPFYGSAGVWFTEPNARLARGIDAPTHPSPAGHSLWFLRHEQAKARAMQHLAADPATRLILCDRNHLGALAYCYATHAEDSLPYRTARDFYARHIAPALPERVLTVILLVSPAESLRRRGGTAELPRWRQWFDPDLLERLHHFYTHIAPGLCPSPPLIVDTDHTSIRDVLGDVAEHLRAADVPVPGDPADVPLLRSPDQDPLFARAYGELGGLEALGHPASAPFDYRHGTVQLYQLGALHRTPDARTTLWNPLADHPTLRAAS